jgi:hypothetical protein
MTKRMPTPSAPPRFDLGSWKKEHMAESAQRGQDGRSIPDMRPVERVDLSLKGQAPDWKLRESFCVSAAMTKRTPRRSAPPRWNLGSTIASGQLASNAQ